MSPSRVVLLLAACGAAGALVTPACDDTYVPPVTSDFDLAEVSVSCRAESNGESVLVTVSVGVPSEDGGSFDDQAELGFGDVLSLRAGMEERELAPFGDTAVRHRAAIVHSTATEFEIALVRGSERAAASIALPPPFALEGPAQPVAADAPIDLTWEAASDATAVRAFGPCLLRPFHRELAQDTGSYAIQPSDLAFDDGSGACELQVSVARTARSAAIGPRGACDVGQVRSVRVEVMR